MEILKSKSWLFTAGVSVSAIAYLYFFFLPGQEAIDEIRTTITRNQQTITQSDNMYKTIQNSQNDVKQTIAYVEKWIQDAPSSSDMSSTFGEIHRIAKLAGVSIKSFEPASIVQLATIRKVPVKMVITGKFTEMTRFIVHLEKMSTTIWIKKCVIGALKENGQSTQCELDLVIFADNDGNSD